MKWSYASAVALSFGVLFLSASGCGEFLAAPSTDGGTAITDLDGTPLDSDAASQASNGDAATSTASTSDAGGDAVNRSLPTCSLEAPECLLDCTGGKCVDAPIVCPDHSFCRIRCSSAGDCKKVVCLDSARCVIECTSPAACEGVTVFANAYRGFCLRCADSCDKVPCGNGSCSQRDGYALTGCDPACGVHSTSCDVPN